MICIARILGAPDTVPAGKHARSTSKASAPARSRPITWLTRCMTYEYRSVTMNSVTFTDPSSATRPTSLRPRSTSITCSARSFGSFFICRSMARSCASVVPRGWVPAIGRSSTRSPSTRTRTSGDEPTIVVLPRRRKKRYGDGLIVRSAVVRRVQGRRVALANVRVGHDEQPVAQVVEDEQRVAQHEHGVGQPEVVARGRGQPLHVTDHVVREVADGAALETRQARHGDGLELAKQPAQRLERGGRPVAG